MIKIFMVFLSAAIFGIACNENNTPSTDEAAAKNDTATMIAPPTSNEANMIVAVNEVSPEEMKDDSVFTDGSIPTTWDVAGITDVRGLKLFLKQAQQWVMNNDKAQLALAVQYPLNDIKNKEELMGAYDQIFTKEVKLSFAMINFNQIFRNSKGVMTAGGKAWITQDGNSFKIFAINP